MLAPIQGKEKENSKFKVIKNKSDIDKMEESNKTVKVKDVSKVSKNRSF